ncbi:MAG: TerB family tellurite resistance protein [Geminicoccaceae bacterium]
MRRFLSILFGDDTAVGEAHAAHSEAHVAAAALMVEAARLDGSFGEEERDRIRTLLVERFQLTPWTAGELLARAERTATESVAWQGFTRAIKDELPPEERIAVIEMLWEVVYADGRLHDYEASLLRRVAGLLYVSDRDSGEARLRVMARLGITRG